MPIIETIHLIKKYPKPSQPSESFNAVDDVSLLIDKGLIYGILGPNGAGKTTTLEMLEGLATIDGGKAFIDGLCVNDEPYKVKRIIGVQLQNNEYFENLSCKELLKLFGALYGCNINAEGLLAQVNLEGKVDANPSSLSGGQKQRFSIACALVNTPLVLFLDEPTTGLDPQAKHNLWTLIKRLNENGMTIVLTTHNMEEAENLCHRIAIMDQGKVVAEDTPKMLIQKYAPDPREAPLQGSLEDVFLVLTGHDLKE